MIGDFELARHLAEWIALVAVTVIGLAVLIASVLGISDFVRGGRDSAFDAFKRRMARGLLIGLDLLIAFDIIESVTLERSLETIIELGLLVIIRTFLSWSLVLEVEGRWPWQRRDDTAVG